ncbi:MAG: adenosylmethionine decarboxylase [Thiobacillus sp.]|nr:adenosylmethionine decarboxylase [Thiobacillus sp.]
MNENHAPGLHLLIDFWGAHQPTGLDQVETLLRAAAEACGARVLEVRLHGFGDGGGITGVAILAESHISLHTWPERDFIALDIFLCGDRDTAPALKILKDGLSPKHVQVSELRRGHNRNRT